MSEEIEKLKTQVKSLYEVLSPLKEKLDVLEDKERMVFLETLVGKCFETQNANGSNAAWTLYRKLISVIDGRTVMVLSIQTRPGYGSLVGFEREIKLESFPIYSKDYVQYLGSEIKPGRFDSELQEQLMRVKRAFELKEKVFYP